MANETTDTFSDVPLPDVTRVEVIDHSQDGTGRAWSKWGLKGVEISFQDGGRTMKVFVK